MAEEVIGLLFGVEGVGVNGASGQEIVKGLTQIVNEINSGKSDVPEIKFKFDTTEATKAVTDLKKQLKDIEKIASIKVTQSGRKFGQSNEVQEVQKQIKRYQKLSATIKQWAQTSKQGAKLAEEYSTITRGSDGTLSGTAQGYEKTIKAINKVNEAMKELQITFKGDGTIVKPSEDDFKRIATEIGITEEQYAKLFNQVKTGSATVGVNVENAQRSTQNAWDKQVRNVSQQINQMYDTISKNPAVKKMADELRQYMQEGSGDVGDLKNRFDALTRAAVKSGANIETWGDKFKKTFANNIRSALAGVITASFTKYLREIYQNVVKLDSAMTDLQIASGKTREEVKELTKGYADLAKQLGATTAEVAEAADTWLRQGYSIEETNTLIKNSTMLSKLGQIEAAEASTALTSAMKGYGVAVEDATSIVDKLTKVDMEAAASAGDIATAMAETATSAKLSGVSMDKLIGYITTVKEVTQDGSESVGVFFKTLFARMNNVSAGKFVDDETGEALNDVETVLNELNITLRTTNGDFRDTSDVLDEVASRWNEFNDTQRNAISTAMAGSRNFEKFSVLMENYGNAMNYANTAATSSGTAMEKYGAYTESLEGRLNALTASFEKFSMSVLDSDLIAFFISILDGAVKGLNAVTDFANSAIVAFAAAIAIAVLSIALLNKALTSLGLNANLAKTSFGDLVAAIQLGSANIGQALLKLATNPVVYIGILVATFASLSQDMPAISAIVCAAILGIGTAVAVACHTANNAVWAFMASNPLGLILAAVTALVLCVMSVVKWIQKLCNANAEARKAALETAAAMQEQADAMKEVAETSKEAADSVKMLIDELDELQSSGELDASEWMENIEAIGDEVSKLFPDEHLTSLQAINRLLGKELSYNELINMTMEERTDLLNNIESGTRTASTQAAREAYKAQKNASAQLTYALTTYGYDLENTDDTWTWGNKSKNSIAAAIKEAEEIASNIDGLDMSENAGYDIDIKVNASSMSDYVNILSTAVDKYEELYRYNFGALSENAVYKYLKDSLSQAEESLNAQQSALQSLIEQAIAATGDGLSIGLDESASKEEVKNYYDSIVNTLLEKVKTDEDISTAITDGLLGDKADDAIREYAQEYIRKYHTELFNAANNMPITVTLKSAIDIFDELDGEYTLLKDAMDEFNETGMVSAKTIRSMTDEFPDLLKYINQTKEGFTLIDDTLDSIMADYWKMKAEPFESEITAAYEYYDAVKKAYDPQADNALEQFEIIKSAYNDLKKAVKNGEDFITAFYMTNDTLLEEQYTQMLEKQKDAIEDQADAFSELCDIRKELLKTYKEEKDYADELAKKQQNVANLQKKLSVAQLDGSAAGQARVRELEAELKEAQDELDDFTLEHAIDVLTVQIESENTEYKALMENAVQRLENSISAAGTMNATALSNAITQLGGTPIANGGYSGATDGITDAIERVQSDITGNTGTQLPDNAPVSSPTKTNSKKDDTGDSSTIKASKKKLEKDTDYKVSGLSGGLTLGHDDITVTIDDHAYDVKVAYSAVNDSTRKSLNKLYENEDKAPVNGTIACYNGSLYITKKGTWRKLFDEEYDQLYNAYTTRMNNYHTGGLVGDISTLSSGEEFAKLLKGEFVSTPAQMKRFMEETLPQIANYSATGGSNEFNAPLIKIACESVTTEALPELERVVNEAVKEIQKQLDSGISRTGFKRTPTKRLT